MLPNNFISKTSHWRLKTADWLQVTRLCFFFVFLKNHRLK